MFARKVALFAGLILTTSLALAQEFPWQTDFTEAKAIATQQKKPLMLYFTTDWCGWCKIMEKETFLKPSVIKQASGYIPVKLNAEKEGKALAAKYKVSAYPHFVFVDTDGAIKGEIPGFHDEVGFLSKVKSALAPKDERAQIEAVLKKNPKDPAALTAKGLLLIQDDKLEEAAKALKEAHETGYKAADLAIAYSQLGIAIGMNNPDRAIAMFQTSIKLDDRNSKSVTYDRIMQLLAQTGKMPLMYQTAEEILKAKDINPELTAKAESMVKGTLQRPKIDTVEHLLSEIQVQFSGQEGRDPFFFRNLFEKEASFKVIFLRDGQVWNWVVDQHTYIETFGIDKLKTKFTFENPQIQKGANVATVQAIADIECTLTNGEVTKNKAQIYLTLVQQSGRWSILSFCQEPLPTIEIGP